MLKQVPAATDAAEQGKWSLTEPGARRSLILLALGAVIGLGIAGFGLFAAKGTGTHTVPPENVALINQQPILVSDFTTQLQNEFGIPIGKATEAQRKKVLNDMINEELMVQRGMEMNLPGSDPDVRSALVAGVELQNSANVLAKQPSPSEMQAYYDAHKDRYRTQGVLTLLDVYLAPSAERDQDQIKATLDAAAKELRAGAAADAVIKKYALQTAHKVNGEELDFAARIHLGDTLYNAIIDDKAGQISDPIVDKDGTVHLIQVGKRVPSVQLTLAEASNQVFTDYKKDAQDRVQADNISFLKSKAEIMLQKGYVP
ncbi:MAG: peptidyl-prolyl cis-trans isomerase [Caulobacteraceae bacterium]